jgi:hypothetical protein
MSFNQRQQPHGGPAGAPQNAGPDFNAMLQRSLHEPGQQELGVEAPQRPSSSIGEVASTRAACGDLGLTRHRRIWRCIQCDATTTTWAECTGRSTGTAAATDSPGRFAPTSVFDVGDVA